MAAKKKQPPDGRLRVSQLVTTFGPGAMVDLLEHAVLISGLEYWRYDGRRPLPAIEEDRLREAILPKLKAQGLTLGREPFMTGPPGDDDNAGPWNGIQVAEFPLWFVCQNPKCKALSYYKALEQKNGRFMHQCGRTVSTACVPVRFVATCKHGHLSEFPWNWFVHSNEQRCDGRDLYFKEDSTGDFSELKVHCNSCNAERALSEARHDGALPACTGERPWLGRQADEPCDQHLKLLSRTASNAYFTQKMSALAIPEKGRELEKALASSKLWPTVKNFREASVVASVRPHVDIINSTLTAITGKPASDFSDEEIAAAVRKLHGGEGAPRERIRTAEYKEFLTAKNEVPGEVPPLEADFFASKLVSKTLPHPALADITLVKKLRGVTAQVGFTRLSAPVADLQGDYGDEVKISPLTLTQDWLPATETFGEGVLLRFKEEAIRKWEEQEAVKERGRGLFAGFMREFGDTVDPSRFPGVRYFMLHSLSHLLMNAMSLECGYAAASLGERIYCAPADDPTPMAAILIMTASSGAEGTLGGLVEQGRRMGVHLERALEMARLCSNDPVCASHAPKEDVPDQTGRNLEGAACHGCMYIAEPSCERFNGYLDRTLVVPTMRYRELAFFS